MSALDPTTVLERWRSEAESFDRFGQAAPAAMLRRCAEDLREWWETRARELVTTEEAIEISGYSRSALESMRRDGKLTAAGSPGDPRYVAGELPSKPRRLDTGEPDLASMVLDARGRG
jgi:hypothetical protein